MCGIVGVASTKPINDKTWLKISCDAIAHRGPDSDGQWWSSDNAVGLGHRRLSIFDLSNSGSQPMHKTDKGLSLVFNGEIYNFLDIRDKLKTKGYSFFSESDTEVLLSAYDFWGKDCVKYFKGMFAFALYDSNKKIIFLARDRAGEKPLFYSHYNGSLFFASELKALLKNPKMPRKINKDALDCYLSFGYVPGDMCILDSYNKLPAGSIAEYDLTSNTLNVSEYWDLPHNTDQEQNLSDNYYIDKLDQLLDKSIQLQMEADVNVGVLLSGGVDSSLITAIAARHINKVKTFTISFSGYNKFDESDHARLIAKKFNTEHVELNAEASSADFLNKLAIQVDEPMADSSIIPTYMVSKLVKEHCTVALGGDGGDELFAGYGHYPRILWLENKLRFIPLGIRKLIGESANTILPIGFKGRNWLQSLNVDFQNGLPQIGVFFDKKTRKNLLNGNDPNKIAEDIYASRVPCNSNILERSTRMDFKNYLAEDILVKVDRASMLNSLEMRAPFLDHDIINFAFSEVPQYLKANKSDKKILLKLLAKRLLPDEFDFNRKQGFSIPLSSWLKSGPFRSLFNEVLLDDNCLFNKEMIIGLLNGQDKGMANGERLFSLVMFELWRIEYDCYI